MKNGGVLAVCSNGSRGRSRSKLRVFAPSREMTEQCQLKTFVPFVPLCEKKPGSAFTLMVACHCVAATREVDPRHSTRDLRLEQRPQKDLCVPCERKTLKLLVKAYRG